MVSIKIFLPILFLLTTSFAFPQTTKLEDLIANILKETENTPVQNTDSDPSTEEGVIKSIFNTNVNSPVQSTVPYPSTEEGLIKSIFNTNVNSPVQNTDTNLKGLIKDIFNTNDQDPVTELPECQPTLAIPKDEYKSCGLDRVCVPRFLCNDGNIIGYGEDIIDIRSSMNGTDCGYLEVCCYKSCYSEDPVKPPVSPVQNIGCGYRNPNGVRFRISGGLDNEAQFGEFPWMVAVLHQEHTLNETFNLYQCGGALITSTVVVTAAHCVQNYVADANSMMVRAGEWDTQTVSEVLPYEDRQVSEIILHEKFNNRTVFNDIALLIVNYPYEFQEHIRPICLPPPNTNFDLSRCFATGWGKDKFGKEGRYQVILKKIELPVMPRNQCQSNLRTTRLGRFFRLHQSFICAGGELGMDVCKGDGGSPLVCPISGSDGQFYQAGIVSWGIGCGDQDIPGVYANIAHLRPWINEKLSNRRIDFGQFTV